jgi:amino-acid N-acetyltransferase
MRWQTTVRRARLADVGSISALVNGFAAEDVMLPRTPEQVALALDDYVVATDAHGRVLACGALREYSPSLAELVSLAVAREAHGRGLGRLIVAAVERLAVARGFTSIFAHTLTPAFFENVGYDEVDRRLYPEKCARPHTTCLRRALAVGAPSTLAAAA